MKKLIATFAVAMAFSAPAMAFNLNDNPYLGYDSFSDTYANQPAMEAAVGNQIIIEQGKGYESIHAQQLLEMAEDYLEQGNNAKAVTYGAYAWVLEQKYQALQ